MKSRNTLLFLLTVIFCLALLGYFFPKDGITIGSITLEFPNPIDVIRGDTTSKVDLDKVLNESENYFNKEELKSLTDSLKAFENFSAKSPSRIYYPNSQKEYFNELFEMMQNAKANKKIIRIMHYGDSQIEVDRITDILRQNMQEEFGGSGPGLIPAIQTIPSRSVSQDYTGDLKRFTVYGSSTDRASHRRYGIMGLVNELNGQATINFRTRAEAYSNAKEFSKIRLIVGHNSAGFKASCSAGGQNLGQKTIDTPISGVSILTWNTDKPVKNGTIQLQGVADIYGITLDGSSGISIDNIPMRGCSGTIFTGIDSLSLANAYSNIDTKLIILEFGGNIMPQISSEQKAEWFGEQIAKQIQYLKRVHPNSLILFIGPSDMSKNIKGSKQTWPYLVEVKNAIKKATLENGAAFWDMFDAMGGTNSMPEWVKAQPALATTDYIHFTPLGANKISEMLHSSIMNEYEIFKIHQQYKLMKEGKISKKEILKNNEKKNTKIINKEVNANKKNEKVSKKGNVKKNKKKNGKKK